MTAAVRGHHRILFNNPSLHKALPFVCVVQVVGEAVLELLILRQIRKHVR
jgi:hypothetical protein